MDWENKILFYIIDMFGSNKISNVVENAIKSNNVFYPHDCRAHSASPPNEPPLSKMTLSSVDYYLYAFKVNYNNFQ